MLLQFVPGFETLVPHVFQWAPTLGGECYTIREFARELGVSPNVFQWAPTLGGECYSAIEQSA